MRNPSMIGPVALGAAAGLLAAAVGDVTLAATAGVVGLTVLGTGRDSHLTPVGARRARAPARRSGGRR